MNLRKAIFWIHLILGVLAGLIVLLMSLTGVALTYQKQITSWADKRAYPVHAPRLSAAFAGGPAQESSAGQAKHIPGRHQFFLRS